MLDIDLGSWDLSEDKSGKVSASQNLHSRRRKSRQVKKCMYDIPGRVCTLKKKHVTQRRGGVIGFTF